MILPLLLLLGVLAFLSLEAFVVARDRRNIRILIHVNGTRGKSSVTEYVASGLRACGIRAFAKITGTIPTIISPDGSRLTLKRTGPARVQEQFRLLRRASANNAEALVLECMSISPANQMVESHYLQPSIQVITNIRDDHREELGGTDEQRAEAMCSAIPQNAAIVTAEGILLNVIRKQATKMGSTLVSAPVLCAQKAEQLPPGVFPTNIALALTVCTLAGCDEETAFRGMMQESAAHHALQTDFRIGNANVKFINGFSVNDVPSAKDFIARWWLRSARDGDLIILLNTRSDRPLRTKTFVEWLARNEEVQTIIMVGTHQAYARRLFYSLRGSDRRIVAWREKEIHDVGRSLVNIVLNRTTIVGIGNIAGDGFKILDAVKRIAQGESVQS